MVLPSDAAKPSATSHGKINGTQSLQHLFSAYKLSVYALQWLLPDIVQDSIIDVLGQHFRCNHSQMPAILHFVAHRGFLCSAARAWLEPDKLTILAVAIFYFSFLLIIFQRINRHYY